jgi:hypothetical protein
VYECKAENLAGIAHKTVGLEVGKSPTIISSPSPVLATIEKRVNLQCRVYGVPQPIVKWMKNSTAVEYLSDRYVVLSDGTLQIQNVQVEDKGHFTCRATNKFGSQEKLMELIVTGLVAPVIAYEPPVVQLMEGQDLRINCFIINAAVPKATIHWYKNGIPLEESPSVSIQGDKSLLLIGGNPEDEGHYTCRAVNAAGNASMHVNVEFIKKPQFMDATNSNLAIIVGQPLLLDCSLKETPKPATITWMKVSVRKCD